MALITLAPETVVLFTPNNFAMFDAMKQAGLIRQLNDVEVTRISLFIADHEELFGAETVVGHWHVGLETRWPTWGLEFEEGILAVLEFPKKED